MPKWQPNIQLIHISIVETTLNLLKSPHIQIQYEGKVFTSFIALFTWLRAGYEMLRELVHRTSLQDAILTQLIAILKTQADDSFDESTDGKLWTFHK